MRSMHQVVAATKIRRRTSRELLAAAARGDEDAFGRLVDPSRGELEAHCYRMLGSVHDAQDALQETLLRAWRRLGQFEGRGSLRSWLYTIATNACLDAIKRPTRVLPVDHGDAAGFREAPGEALAEPVWIEPYADRGLDSGDGFIAPDARYELRETVELAFVAALQHLPARQRAALILSDVLGFSARETATSLATTPASVNSALQRARRAVEERLPDRSQQATLRALGDERVRRLVNRYVDAWERGDVDAIVAMLAEDVTFSMPPVPTWYHSRAAVAAFIAEWPLSLRWRFLPALINGQLAFGTYAWDPGRGRFVAHALDVLTLRGERVAAVTAFIGSQAFARFDLPTELKP